MSLEKQIKDTFNNLLNTRNSIEADIPKLIKKLEQLIIRDPLINIVKNSGDFYDLQKFTMESIVININVDDVIYDFKFNENSLFKISVKDQFAISCFPVYNKIIIECFKNKIKIFKYRYARDNVSKILTKINMQNLKSIFETLAYSIQKIDQTNIMETMSQKVINDLKY